MPAAAATDDVEAGEIELLGDPENLDVVDELDERWAPGEPAPGIPADEVLTVHALTETELSADQLGIPDEAFDLPAPDGEVPVEQPEAASEETRARTPLLGGTLEIRYEEFDEPDTA